MDLTDSDWELDIILILVASLLKLRRAGILPRNRRSRALPRRTFTEITKHLSDRAFRDCFRMSRPSFDFLLDIVRRDISKFSDQEEMEEERSHRSGNSTQAQIILAVAIRMLAGGSTHDIALAFDIGFSTVYTYLHSVVDSISNRIHLDSIPTNERELRTSALKFATSRPSVNPLPGCVGAIDGITIAIERPQKIYNPSAFYCRKGYYAIPVQGLVNSEYKFAAMSAFCTGSTHDSAALKMSNIGKFLDEGNLPIGYWIAGDEAYCCSENLLTPFKQSFTIPYTDSFNFFQSSHRIHVEQAFGMWVNKWRILKKPLAYSLVRTTKIIIACAILHNFCINFGDCDVPMDTDVEKMEHAEYDLETWLLWVRTDLDLEMEMDGLSNQLVNVRSRSALQSITRNRLVTRLQRHGLLRPLFGHS